MCWFVDDPLLESCFLLRCLKLGPAAVSLISLSGCYAELNKLFVCGASVGVSLGSQG